MAEMVWCQSCKTVVWAYDSQPSVDLRGICNMLQLPCPKCGDQGNFDGWCDRGNTLQHLKELFEPEGYKIFDWWSVMKAIANQEKVAWDPSRNNHWFQKDLKTQEGLCPLCRHRLW